MPYAQVPDHVILDTSLTPLQRRLYEFIDLKAGSRGYWDDSLSAIAEAMAASRRHLSDAMAALVERGLIEREKLGHWRSRFVVVARVAGKQLVLEAPVEVGGGAPVGRRGVRPTGAGGAPVGRSNDRSHLYSDKELIPRRRSHTLRVAGEAYNRVALQAWPEGVRDATG